MTVGEVVVLRCWGGCGRIRLDPPWTPQWLPILVSEGRVVIGEYLCSHHDCPARAIAEGGSPG